MKKDSAVSLGPVGPKTFEDVLRDLGGFGRFQVLSLVLILSLEIPTAFLAFVTIFTGFTPKHWQCDGADIRFVDICKCNGTLRTNESSVVSEWNLVCESKWVSDFLTSVQMLGTIIGSVYAGKLSDWYGRKPTLTGTVLLMGLATAVSAVATNPYVYGAARALCGAGLASFLGVSSIYTMEFLTPDMRPLGGAVGPWGWAIMLMALLAYYIRSWRNLLWANVAPFGLIFLVYPFLPESPRWLLRNQKVKEAHQVINKIARINGKKPLTLDYVQKLAEQEKCGTVQRFSYLQFFKLEEMRMTTLYLMGIWGAWSLVNFGIGFNIKNFPGNIYFNVMLLGATDAVGYPMSLLISNRLGRRRSLAVFMTIAATFLVALAMYGIFEKLEDHNIILLTLCLLGKLGVSGARGCVRTVTGESYPTAIRGMGTCICGVSNGVASVLAPQLAFLGSQWPSVPYFAFAGISVGGAMISFLLQETHGKDLSDNVDDKKGPVVVQRSAGGTEANNNKHSNSNVVVVTTS